MKKLNKLLSKIPISLLIIFLICFQVVSGIVISLINVREASIIQQFSLSIFVFIIVLYLISIINTLINNICYYTCIAKITELEYTKTLKKVFNSRISDIQNLSAGKIFSTTKELGSLKSQLYTSSISIISTVMPFIVLLYKELLVDYRMAVISIVSVIVCCIMSFLTDRLFGWNTIAKQKRSDLDGVTVDNFTNIKTLKYLKQTKFAENRLHKYQEDARPYTINIPQRIWFCLTDFIGILPLIINIFLSRHNIELLAMVVLSNYTIDNMRWHLLNISYYAVEINAQNNIIANLKECEDIANPLSDTLFLENIIFDYGEDSETFYIDYLVFIKNTRTLIYGESGTGKSSLANLIAGGIIPKIGKVPLYDSYYVWQETEVLDDSLWHNIVFDNEENIGEYEVFELFKDLNMTDWFVTLKDGFDTIVGERGCRLSSGQKQRINIVRLILCMRYHPEKIFIVDEITSNLDSVTRELAINLIDRECQSTLIAISHNDGFEKICSNKILVKNHRFIPVF